MELLQLRINGKRKEAAYGKLKIKNGIYNTDVTVAVHVVNPIAGTEGVYAGLQEIRYEVLNLGEVTQDGVLYSFDILSPSPPQLLRVWESDRAIEESRALNNSNEVEIRVYAVDNAGNEGKNSAAIKIDTTAPTAAAFAAPVTPAWQ